MKKSRFLTHAGVNFVFNKSPKDFTVDEIPLYEFSGEGEHTVATIRKKDMTTWELLSLLSSATGAKLKEIGYAGLKDRDGMTIQSVSFPKKFEENLKNLEHPNVKILNVTRHNNKIKLGHLKGNKFFIRLKKINKTDFAKLDQGLAAIAEHGMPNYFGYQRFGRDQNNHIAGLEITEGKRSERNQNLKRLLINAYQSYLFNEWLSFRIDISRLSSEFSGTDLTKALDMQFAVKNIELRGIDKKYFEGQKHFFKLFLGETMCHYPYGRLFGAENLADESDRFAKKQISPTGLLCSNDNKLPKDDALLIESAFLDTRIKALGDRRYAWIFPEEIKAEYDEENAHAKIWFFLPKGSYATTLLEEIVGKELKEGLGEDSF